MSLSTRRLAKSPYPRNRAPDLRLPYCRGPQERPRQPRRGTALASKVPRFFFFRRQSPDRRRRVRQRFLGQADVAAFPGRSRSAGSRKCRGRSVELIVQTNAHSIDADVG